MSDQPPLPPGVQAAPGAAPGLGPLVLNIQYTKDLSFEVPNAPEIFTLLREQPLDDGQVLARRAGHHDVLQVTKGLHDSIALPRGCRWQTGRRCVGRPRGGYAEGGPTRTTACAATRVVPSPVRAGPPASS